MGKPAKTKSKAKGKPGAKSPGRKISKVWLLVAVVLLVLAARAVKYTEHHHAVLAVSGAVLVFAAALIALAVRPVSALVNRFGSRFIVRSWAPATAPQARRARRLPEPLAQEAQVQPFAGTVATWTSSPAPVAEGCQGPGCANPLDADPDARWRAGTSVPAEASYDDGSPGGPVQVGEIHEFCSEQCAMKWVGAGEML
jgi:hypothetical protein